MTGWIHTWRPGVYQLDLTVTHEDTTTTAFGTEEVIVTPSAARLEGSLLEDWSMYCKAFLPIHGPSIEHILHITPTSRVG